MLLSHFLHRPSDVVPTQLSDETSSLSGSDTPFTVPTLTLLPPCTPTSNCLSATPRSPSLTSRDSWSSFDSTDEEDNSVSSTDSELSLSDCHFTSSDDDDNEEMEEGDESECLSSTTTGNEELQAEFGTEIIGNCIHVFPVVSSGIVADECSTSQGDDNDFESDQFITLSKTSSEEELQMIFGTQNKQQKQNEDTTDEDKLSTEHQNPMLGVSAVFPPQITVPETLSGQYFRCISTDYCLKSGNSVAVSRTTSEEKLKNIEDEDTDHNKMVFSELQNTVPGMPAFIPPQMPVHSRYSTTFQPAETNFVRCTKPAPLTLSLSGDDSDIPTTPPPGPSTTEAEEMWKEYTKKRSTAPEYFLFPPFTPEQEEWIVATNHPFKEYVLQTLAVQHTFLCSRMA